MAWGKRAAAGTLRGMVVVAAGQRSVLIWRAPRRERGRSTTVKAPAPAEICAAGSSWSAGLCWGVNWKAAGKQIGRLDATSQSRGLDCDSVCSSSIPSACRLLPYEIRSSVNCGMACVVLVLRRVICLVLLFICAPLRSATIKAWPDVDGSVVFIPFFVESLDRPSASMHLLYPTHLHIHAHSFHSYTCTCYSPPRAAALPIPPLPSSV